MTERGITDPTDLAFQRGDWRRERIGWALMTLLVVAAVLGLFGQGLVYEFDLDPEATSGTARLRFTVRPDTVGVASGEVELVGHSTHSIRQFVFP